MATTPEPIGDMSKRPVKPPAPPAPPPTEVVFHEYPKLIYAWPLIVFGVLFYFLPAGWSQALGWVYLFITLVVVTTLAIDLERNYVFVWTVIFALFFFVGKWLHASFDIPVFGSVFGFFYGLGASYDPGYGLALALLLSLPYGVMLVWVRLNHRWRITHNEFEHYAWGRADDSLARGAKRVRSTFPDLLEFLLCGAGTLVVYSATGRSELRRISNVPMLIRVRRKIDALLESQQVTIREDDASAEAEAESEQEEQGSHPQDDDADTPEAEGIGGRDPL